MPLQETSPNQTSLVSSDLKQTGIVSSDLTEQREVRSRGSSVGSADGESKGRDRKPGKGK